MEPAFYLVVGLGNPGKKHSKNRHNVGFRCVDYLAETCSIELKQRKRFKASLGEGTINLHRVILAKPLTFMNSSGSAIAPLARWYKIPRNRILVIHDDLDLPLGKVRLKPGGGSGGHRGVSSIIETMGTSDFARLRIGIGRPTCEDAVDYVLANFGRDQEPVIKATCELVGRIVPFFLESGIEKAMNRYNGDNG